MTSERKGPLSNLRYAGDSTLPQRPQLQIQSEPVAPSPLASVFGDDDDFQSNLSDSGEIITIGGDDLGLYDGLPVSELQEPEQKPAARGTKTKVHSEVGKVTPNDKVIFNGMQDLGGWVTGKHAALMLNKEYATKKRRLTQLERGGYLESRKKSGLKLYNVTKYANARTDRQDEKIYPWPEHSNIRHHLVLATQVILLRNSRRPGELQLLPDDYTLDALPVVHENLLKNSVQKVWDEKYGNDIYLRDWRAICQRILDSPNYPVVESYDDSMWAVSPEHVEYLDLYFRKAGGGTAAAALQHWDDNYAFANTRRSRAGKDGSVNRHARRPDAVIVQPHLRVDGINYGMNIAVEVELSRKDKAEYRNIIRQYLDHPLYGGLLYPADRTDIVTSLKAAWNDVFSEEMEKAQQTGEPSKIEYFNFQVVPPVYLHKEYDVDGFFG